MHYLDVGLSLEFNTLDMFPSGHDEVVEDSSDGNDDDVSREEEIWSWSGEVGCFRFFWKLR